MATRKTTTIPVARGHDWPGSVEEATKAAVEFACEAFGIKGPVDLVVDDVEHEEDADGASHWSVEITASAELIEAYEKEAAEYSDDES